MNRYLRWLLNSDDARAAARAVSTITIDGDVATYPCRDENDEDIMWAWFFNVFSINANIIVGS